MFVCGAYVASVNGSSGEYLVKWKGLPYSECTKEDADLVRRRFPLAVDEYNLRQKSHCLPSKHCKVRVDYRYLFTVQPVDYVAYIIMWFYSCSDLTTSMSLTGYKSIFPAGSCAREGME